MDEFEQVYNDPATAKRVKRDLADGKALGVEGTPSFFINGDKAEIESFNDLVAKIDAELGE